MGARLGELVEVLGISQNEFAVRVGTAPSFVSDVTRGLKRPGAEFFHRVRETFGVSIDWLLDGSGSMFGGRPIDMDGYKLIAAQVELVRRARIDGDPKAEALLNQLLGSSGSKPIAADRVVELLRPYIKFSEELLLPAVIYNSYRWAANNEQRLLGGLNAALAYIESKRPLDVLKALTADTRAPSGPGESSAPGVRQINIGSSVRAAAGDYHEHHKRPKRK